MQDQIDRLESLVTSLISRNGLGVEVGSSTSSGAVTTLDSTPVERLGPASPPRTTDTPDLEKLKSGQGM